MAREPRLDKVDIEKHYSVYCVHHVIKYESQFTHAPTAKRACKNIAHRLGAPRNPESNYSDDYCEWKLRATLA